MSDRKNNQVVIVVGSGGREHALGWKISQSPRVDKVYFAPGNGGTFENIGISQNDVDKIAEFAAKFGQSCLTVVGPEEPLSRGVTDVFQSRGLRILGPTASASRLETSKVYSKEFMLSANIPTAQAKIFSDAQMAFDYVRARSEPLVVKADGIASGKGVIVCEDSGEAMNAVQRIMVNKEFGHAGDKVVIEERLVGEEASFIALCDGHSLIPLESSQDHKRALDGDKGPNTGGMGAYSPARIISPEMKEEVMKLVMEPAMREMKSRGSPFVGFLYAGIMVDQKSGKPYVLEFNVRMGDPECQAVLLRLESDLFEYLDAAATGSLDSMAPLKWSDKTAVCVVMASRGYPGPYNKGMVINGLKSDYGPAVKVFHAGTTRRSDGSIITSGGRVLGVSALGEGPREAIDRAYSAVREICWGENDQYYRTDIAMRALE